LAKLFIATFRRIKHIELKRLRQRERERERGGERERERERGV